MRTPRRSLLALLLPTLASLPAAALQIVDTQDGATAVGRISLRETTRIKVEGAQITGVVGNIYSSSCEGPPPGGPVATPGTPPAPAAINAGGDVVLECDRTKGEVYVRPVGKSMKPINLFVTTPQATYTLLLERIDTPADTIVLRDKSIRTPKTAALPHVPGAATAGAPAHDRALRAMLVWMATEHVPVDVHVDDVHRPMVLWAESKLLLLRTYTGRHLVGEKFALTNVSASPMVLAEQEFDRPDAHVAAVSIEHHNLRPGDTTTVYVIRQEVAP